MTPVTPAAAAAAELARRDPVMAASLQRHGPPDLAPRAGSHFAALVRSICFQQLAGRAAATIHGRLLAAAGDPPTPESILALPVEAMRACGLSANKTASIRDLAAKVLDGTVELDRVSRLDDATMIAELITVRGIGVWTAQMFLMFQLGRLDVWPTLDLGVRAGFARLYDLAATPTPKALEAEGARFEPYRSVTAWYCWRAMDTVVPDAK